MDLVSAAHRYIRLMFDGHTATNPFKPEQFKDEYPEKLLKVIEAKYKGKQATFKAMKVVHTTGTEDLMAKLKASLKPTKKAS